MKKTFEIIKNSESQTGYQIEDKEFKGMIPGLCCGWQFEVINEDGELAYLSVMFEEETPEEVAYRWMDGELSWLESGLRCNARFTGRVIFRGYARSEWDPEERDYYVVDVDV